MRYSKSISIHAMKRERFAQLRVNSVSDIVGGGSPFAFGCTVHLFELLEILRARQMNDDTNNDRCTAQLF